MTELRWLWAAGSFRREPRSSGFGAQLQPGERCVAQPLRDHTRAQPKKPHPIQQFCGLRCPTGAVSMRGSAVRAPPR